MDRAAFIRWSDDTGLTRKQAEAFYRRHVAGEGRQEAAAAMDTSTSNLDNLERAAREKIRKAANLRALLAGVDYEYDGEIGTCAKCDAPTDTLKPLDGDMETLICPDCADVHA